MTKKSLGQFFTTNYEYILNGFNFPSSEIQIIEPFAGNKDLLKILNGESRSNVVCYDIDPKHDDIIKQDTLNFPPVYQNKFILTNPPYLARNDTNDLYKCFIKNLLINPPIGGIIIVPLNFWSSIRQSDQNLRRQFLEIFCVNKLNIFEEKVFDDTSYTVCSFQFSFRPNNIENCKINTTIYPKKTNHMFELFNYSIGGEIYELPLSKFKISRLTRQNKSHLHITNINVKCIDDNINNKIKLILVSNEERIIDNTANLSNRTYATLMIEPTIDLDKQRLLVVEFNTFLNSLRDKYNSLFLSNYRESKDIARKRISFDLIYQIVSHILSK